MPISQIGSVIYANQNMQVAASKQIDFQGRIEFQNMVARAMLDEVDEIQETRALEEDEGINPEKRHNQQTNEESTGEKETEEKAVLAQAKKNKKDDEDSGEYHILDIVV